MKEVGTADKGGLKLSIVGREVNLARSGSGVAPRSCE